MATWTLSGLRQQLSMSSEPSHLKLASQVRGQGARDPGGCVSVHWEGGLYQVAEMPQEEGFQQKVLQGQQEESAHL